MHMRIAWWNIVALSAALLAVTTLALWVSVFKSDQKWKTAARTPLAPVKAAPTLQEHFESGDLRFGQMIRPYSTSLFPFQSISLQRTLCGGNCPIYVMTLRRDGPATLVTQDLDQRQTKYFHADISPDLFARATQLAQEAMKTAKKQNYDGQWTDDYFAIMRVESAQGRWCVSDYGQVAPVQIWALEEVLHQFRGQIDWQPSVGPPAAADQTEESWSCPPL